MDPNVTKFNTIFIMKTSIFRQQRLGKGSKKRENSQWGEDKRCKSEPLEPDLAWKIRIILTRRLNERL